MANFLNDIQFKNPIREGIEGYRSVLREIYRAGLISLKDLSQKVLIPIPVISKIVNYMVELKVLDRIPAGILYTENGMQFIESELKFYGFGISKCELCNGHPIFISPRWDNVLDKLDEIFEKRPKVDTTLDQAFATAETSLSRALLLYDRGALDGKKICLLGDDDYSSVAIAFLYLGFFPENPKLIPEEMVVIDIDNRLLEGIKKAVNENSFNIKYKLWDYRTKIPEDLLNIFDIIMIDPPYSENGLRLTLSRAIDMLRIEIGREIYLSFAHRSPVKFLKIQEIITEMGLAIMEITPRFNTYEGATILGNQTQILRLITTSDTKSSISSTFKFEEQIYTGELSPTTRFYYCLKCNKTIEIGETSQIKTIEKLKEIGCPYCKSKEGPFQLEGKVKNNPS
ncbi:bis-aminopropyl spermidine synthase family protein [Promethearchaeum syntrophicum]|uniref:Bis-aminopropyl spermidine synthase family protein n=1 Tax=Promethearchaeum syntrophicum TaxID=2594042 RepID=A0A5B9DCP1_9ARCH|nr:bis-aminopropyl spermidine synthase family protein [Candidatus Prometheoarchaeum syntrophicum]QEE16924.1 hypothetical protein DSAG12_02754 [Candidatus Prometheoarchaeum syntrophicum]